MYIYLLKIKEGNAPICFGTDTPERGHFVGYCSYSFREECSNCKSRIILRETPKIKKGDMFLWNEEKYGE